MTRLEYQRYYEDYVVLFTLKMTHRAADRPNDMTINSHTTHLLIKAFFF